MLTALTVLIAIGLLALIVVFVATLHGLEAGARADLAHRIRLQDERDARRADRRTRAAASRGAF